MKAYLHQARISPLKVNLIAKLVRGRSVPEALAILRALPKRAAPILAKVIRSASANAEHNFKQDESRLTVKTIIVNEGQTLKRGIPVSRGRWHPLLKRSSHITVEVAATGAPEAAVKVAEAPTEEKAPAKKPAAKKAPAAKKTAEKASEAK